MLEERGAPLGAAFTRTSPLLWAESASGVDSLIGDGRRYIPVPAVSTHSLGMSCHYVSLTVWSNHNAYNYHFRCMILRYANTTGLPNMSRILRRR
jgi:hypothetical protein